MKTLMFVLSVLFLIGCGEVITPEESSDKETSGLEKISYDDTSWTFVMPSTDIHEVKLVNTMLKYSKCFQAYNEKHSWTELTDMWMYEIFAEDGSGFPAGPPSSPPMHLLYHDTNTIVMTYSERYDCPMIGTHPPSYSFGALLCIDNLWKERGKYARVTIRRTWPEPTGIYNFFTLININEDYILPDTVNIIRPKNESSVAQQYAIFQWNAATAARKYWLCASIDGWKTLIINDSTLTNTYRFGHDLPIGSKVVWNIATGNSKGWNTSAWCNQYVFYVK